MANPEKDSDKSQDCLSTFGENPDLWIPAERGLLSGMFSLTIYPKPSFFVCASRQIFRPSVAILKQTMTSSFPEEWTKEAFILPGIDQGDFDPESLEEIFHQIDVDKKGFINRADVRRLMGMVGESVDEVDIDEMMRLIDSENTGSISLDQFIESFMNPGALFINPVE